MKSDLKMISLLIEPVWNRNRRAVAVSGLLYSLLIEPVWNRNLALSVSVQGHQNQLLIEPVWNRNKKYSRLRTA